MSSLKKIVVFTATGDQGGSVVKYLVKEGGYEIVAITRNPDSDSAKALAKLGVQVVKGDLEDPASYAPALEGLYGAFVNADFWVKYFSNGMDGPGAREWEYKISSQAIEACAKAGAKHIIYSTLDQTNGLVPHFDSKANVSEWARAQGYPVTDLYTGHYISNLVKFQGLKPLPDGSLLLAVPTPDSTPIWNFAVEQTGGWVSAIFKDPKKFIGARVDACSEVPTLAEWAEKISKVVGKPVKTMGVTEEALREKTSLVKQGVLEELILNYTGFYDGHVKRDLAQSKEIYPEQWDTTEWAANSEPFKAFVASL